VLDLTLNNVQDCARWNCEIAHTAPAPTPGRKQFSIPASPSPHEFFRWTRPIYESAGDRHSPRGEARSRQNITADGNAPAEIEDALTFNVVLVKPHFTTFSPAQEACQKMMPAKASGCRVFTRQGRQVTQMLAPQDQWDY
jgi:hypothetical protein